MVIGYMILIIMESAALSSWMGAISAPPYLSLIPNWSQSTDQPMANWTFFPWNIFRMIFQKFWLQSGRYWVVHYLDIGKNHIKDALSLRSPLEKDSLEKSIESLHFSYGWKCKCLPIMEDNFFDNGGWMINYLRWRTEEHSELSFWWDKATWW